MNKLADHLYHNDKFKDILNSINKDKNNITFVGMPDSSKAYAVYSTTCYSNKSAVIVCSNNTEAKKIMQDLKFFSDIDIMYFPSRDTIYYNIEALSQDNDNLRMEVINKIVSNKKCIIVTTIDAMTQKMLPISTYEDSNLYFETDMDIDMDKTLNKLMRLRI